MDVSIILSELIEKTADDRIAQIFSTLDTRVVAQSLKTIDPTIAEKIFKNVSENDAAAMRHTMPGAIRIEAIEAAQKEIIDAIQKSDNH